MTLIVFKNARVFDGVNAECQQGMQVLVEGDRIREAGTGTSASRAKANTRRAIAPAATPTR